MKIFQVLHGFCHWDATGKHPTLESTQGLYHPSIVFIEAPDYVHESWGFDETQEGDARFIQPIPPEGWAYDSDTGTFYPIDQPPEPETETQDMQVALELLDVHPEGDGA